MFHQEMQPVSGILMCLGLVSVIVGGCGGHKSPPPAPAATAARATPQGRDEFAAAVAAQVLPGAITDVRALAVDKSAPAERRAAAVRELGRRKDFDSMPTVIAVLEDDTVYVRGEAYESAKKIVGIGVRFHDFGPPERRQAAVAAYRRLFELARQNHVRYLIDLVPLLMDRMDSNDLATRQTAGEDIVRLMDWSHGFRADAPRAERLENIAAFRQEWQRWNAPGSHMLDIHRDPEKMREFKAALLKFVRDKQAHGQPWNTNSVQQDAPRDRAGGNGATGK